MFAKEQPDLNWECEEAREKIFDIIRFWNEKGVDGYRVDAISYLDKGLDGRADFQETMGTVACANLEGTHRYIREMAGGQDFSVITINRGRYLFMAMMACTEGICQNPGLLSSYLAGNTLCLSGGRTGYDKCTV